MLINVQLFIYVYEKKIVGIKKNYFNNIYVLIISFMIFYHGNTFLLKIKNEMNVINLSLIIRYEW